MDWSENSTSRAVSAVPSWKYTSFRSVSVQSRAPSAAAGCTVYS